MHSITRARRIRGWALLELYLPRPALLAEEQAVTIEFHFDFGSPNAYLAHKAFPSITGQAGIEFEYVPVLLGGVFVK